MDSGRGVIFPTFLRLLFCVEGWAGSGWLHEKTLKQAIPLLLAVLLLGYVLRGMPLASLLSQLRQASGGWIALTALVMGTQTLLRAVRWRMLLRGLGYSPSGGRALSAMLAGSVSGLIIPGSGELLRCTLLQHSDHVSITESIGSIITERLVDLVSTAAFLLLALLIESGHWLALGQTYLQAPAWFSRLSAQSWAGATAALLLAAALTYLGWRSLVTRGLLSRLNSRLRLRERVNGFRRGLLSIRYVPSPALYWLVTFLIHALSLGVLFTLFRALPITRHVPASASLTIFALTALGSMAMPTQAYIGSYHFFASRGLLAYGLPLLAGTVWATFSHAVITLVNLLFSALGFLAALRFLKKTPPPPIDAPALPNR